jgi:hypothetical protein
MTEPPLDAPDEDWLVWADAMQEQGDPRGALIALGHPLAFVKEHAEQLFGRTLGRHIRKGDIVVTKWRRYHADELELRIADSSEQLVVDTLAAPCAHRLRGLAIAGVPASDGPVVNLHRPIDYLREWRIPPSIVSLSLIDDRARAVDHLLARNYQPGENLVDFGPLFELWLRFAQLEHLKIVAADPGQIRYMRIQLPNLRSFTHHSLVWVQGLGDLLSRARWPALRALELRCCDGFLDNNPSDARAYRSIYAHDEPRGLPAGERFDTPWEVELQPLFESLGDRPLDRLALTSFDDADGILAALDHCRCAVDELVLDDSGLDTMDVDRLARHPIMARVKRLSLQRVKLPSAKGLQGLGVEVVHSCNPRAPTYRYVVGME